MRSTIGSDGVIRQASPRVSRARDSQKASFTAVSMPTAKTRRGWSRLLTSRTIDASLPT